VAFAGDFSGVFLARISNLSVTKKLLDAPAGINTLSFSGSRLAYVTDKSSELVELRPGYELNSRGYFVLTVFSIFLSIVALAHALMIDKQVPRDNLFRIGRSAKSSGVTTPGE
jgi:hypothetical protein